MDQTAKHLDLSLQEQTRGTWKKGRDADHRSMGTMDRSKSVAYIGIGERSQLSREGWIVGLFSLVISKVLEKTHLVGLHPLEIFDRPKRGVGDPYPSLEKGCKLLGYRNQRKRRIHFSFRTTKMRTTDHFRF